MQEIETLEGKMTKSKVPQLGFILIGNCMSCSLWKVGTPKTERKYSILGHFNFGYESLTSRFIIDSTVCIKKLIIILVLN